MLNRIIPNLLRSPRVFASAVSCAFVLLSSSSNAQGISDVSFGFGLRSHFGGMQAYKDMKQFYNENRPWLDNKMSAGGMMNGLEVGLQANGRKFGFGFMHLYGVGSKTVAKGTFNGVEQKRVLKARMWGVETIDVHWTPISIGNMNLGFGAMPFGLGIFRVKTQLNDNDQVKVPLTYLEETDNAGFFRSIHMYAQVHLDLTRTEMEGFGNFHVQFFYSMGPWREYDLYYANREINPTTYPYHLKRTFQKVNNFGIKFLFTPN